MKFTLCPLVLAAAAVVSAQENLGSAFAITTGGNDLFINIHAGPDNPSPLYSTLVSDSGIPASPFYGATSDNDTTDTAIWGSGYLTNYGLFMEPTGGQPELKLMFGDISSATASDSDITYVGFTISPDNSLSWDGQTTNAFSVCQAKGDASGVQSVYFGQLPASTDESVCSGTPTYVSLDIGYL